MSINRVIITGNLTRDALTLAKRTSCRKAWKEALADAEAELGGKEGGNEQD